LLIYNFNGKIKKKIIKTVVWSVAIYDCETCTLQKEEINRINALEM
jgi:hypothetical protein